jgi:hypothetical protein
VPGPINALRSGGPNKPEYDFSSLRGKYQIDELVYVQITQLPGARGRTRRPAEAVQRLNRTPRWDAVSAWSPQDGAPSGPATSARMSGRSSWHRI